MKRLLLSFILLLAFMVGTAGAFDKDVTTKFRSEFLTVCTNAIPKKVKDLPF
jgi:hypothetical protein